MNLYPRSKYGNKQPKNQCWCCGKHLIVSIREKGCRRMYDDAISHGATVYGYACKPYCDRIDEGEKI